LSEDLSQSAVESKLPCLMCHCVYTCVYIVQLTTATTVYQQVNTKDVPTRQRREYQRRTHATKTASKRQQKCCIDNTQSLMNNM